MVAGLKYNSAVWQEQWPRVMRNAIDACKRHGARLVFFDNVYAYGRVDGVMTEHTPFNPTSKKGEVRAKIASLLLDEIRSGNLHAMIVRSADFYGPGAIQSFPHATVFDRLKSRKNTSMDRQSEYCTHLYVYTRRWSCSGYAWSIIGCIRPDVAPANQQGTTNGKGLRGFGMRPGRTAL